MLDSGSQCDSHKKQSKTHLIFLHKQSTVLPRLSVPRLSGIRLSIHWVR